MYRNRTRGKINRRREIPSQEEINKDVVVKIPLKTEDYTSLLDKVQRYTLSPFHVDIGYRRSIILSDLFASNSDPFLDKYGNIWVYRKGENSDNAVIISSHMDTVFGLKPDAYTIKIHDTKDGPEIVGTIDNSVCCAVNAELAQIVKKPFYDTYFVFTCGEEHNHCMGARDVLNDLKSKGVKPTLAIALDVTYPGRTHSYSYTTNNVGQDQALAADLVNVMVGGDWVGVNPQASANTSKTDVNKTKVVVVTEEGDDQTSAYIENTSNVPLESMIKGWIPQTGFSDSVKFRYMSTVDEASVYGIATNAFAFGPVAYGDFHHKDCITYLENLEVCLAFLNELLSKDHLKNIRPQLYSPRGGYHERLRKDYSIDVIIQDGELFDLDKLGGLYLDSMLKRELIRLNDETKKDREEDFLYKFLKDIMPLGSELKTVDIKMPITSLIIYLISDDIEDGGGYVHVGEKNNSMAFIVGEEMRPYRIKMIKILERLGYIQPRNVNLADDGEAPEIVEFYFPTKRGMQETTLTVRVVPEGMLYEDMVPRSKAFFDECRESNTVLMDKILSIRGSKIKQKNKLLDLLYRAHDNVYIAELIMNHDGGDISRCRKQIKLIKQNLTEFSKLNPNQDSSIDDIVSSMDHAFNQFVRKVK